MVPEQQLVSGGLPRLMSVPSAASMLAGTEIGNHNIICCVMLLNLQSPSAVQQRLPVL